MADKPVTREEKYLAYLTGDYTGEIPKPITRKEKYLYEICLKGIGGEISPEEIKAAVNEYLEKNPVKPGATTEQAQQIEQNKTDIASLKEETGSLKEDLSNKITKFYASNQGETHITDSDNGKIMDMMLYGKSEQKQYSGTNLFDAQNAKIISGAFGLSVSISNNGIISIQGTVKGISGKAAFSILRTQELFPLDVVFKAFELKESNCSVVTIRRTIADVSDKRIAIELSGLVTGTEISVSFRLMMSKSEITTYEPFTGGIPSPSPDYPQEIKSVVNPTVKVTNEDGLKVQTVTLPYTLNAIPVSSDGNVTINGQQYIADRVVEKDGVFGIERNTATDVPVLTKELRETPDTKGRFIQNNALKKTFIPFYEPLVNIGYSRKWGIPENVIDKWIFGVNKANLYISPPNDLNYTSEDIFNALKDLNIKIYGALLVPFFEPLPGDIQAKLRTLVTNYPVTNISVTSDQLDGYTVFNYPISMENGWNYVKQQIGDTRDYIYNMDARTQDTDLQAAEAYVNSEYAVALTELEV